MNNKRVVFLGCGAVAKCVLGVLDAYISGVNPKRVTIVDVLDYTSHPDVAKWLERGAKYIVADIRRELETLLSHLKPYDVVIDLSNRTDSLGIITWCKAHNVHYLNTSMEDELPIAEQQKVNDAYGMSYTKAHEQLRNINDTYEGDATILVEMGMNPGLVSVLAKLALRTMASPDSKFAASRQFNRLAKQLGVEVIHISETDSSEFTGPRRPAPSVFCNTWCCDGLNDEYAHDAEFSFGTHERRLPSGAVNLDGIVIDTNSAAYNWYTDSYVPGDETFVGCCIPHGEGLTLGHYLSTPSYHPTVHYVYKWSPATQRSLKGAKAKIGHTFAPQSHVLANYYDDFRGTDRVGVLLLCKSGAAFWCGSILDNSSTGHHSGTLQQVAAGVLLGLMHIMQNPKQGVVYPEVIHEDLVEYVKPLLGRLFCNYVPYTRTTQFSSVPKLVFDGQFA